MCLFKDQSKQVEHNSAAQSGCEGARRGPGGGLMGEGAGRSEVPVMDPGCEGPVCCCGGYSGAD
ncbi:hypothetical protein EYF80_003570 [Liparis tanakae]|uniref:Uncharacterized protein n=1 Tax=Liparis tanakae TaxID=230148 RepID=A0A4Z2J917_9TELE|nr:hypothetical protein EYF80_003570 [Liparis tanakae]